MKGSQYAVFFGKVTATGVRYDPGISVFIIKNLFLSSMTVMNNLIMLSLRV